MKKSELKKKHERETTKTTEGEFIFDLRRLYELSPKLSESIYETAKIHLLKDKQLCEGEIEITVVCIEEKAGRLIEELSKKRIKLTIDNGSEDLKILKDHGRVSLRQSRIQRITDEAVEQGGVMSQEDISRCLRCDTRTIQRDIKAIRERGIEVITRGVYHNIGRGQTHKVKIISLYLDGRTYSEIKRLTQHSTGSIKRYIESFVRVLAARNFGIRSKATISTVTGLSENLVKQYTGLIEQSRGNKLRREKMEELVQSWLRSEELKKRMISIGNKAVAMMGGYV
jgi:biotin operon repressor